MGFLDKLKNLGRKDDQQADQGNAKTAGVGQDQAGDKGDDQTDTTGDGPSTPPTS